jgi:1-acyl-sn-glycerol-3-phosphate acyltransferase
MLLFRLAAVAALVLFAALVDAPIQWLLAKSGRRRQAEALQRGLCRLLCGALGIRLTVTGTPPATGAPVLVVANHVSWADVPVLGSLAPLAFLAKHEVGTWPLVGSVARAHGTLFVERGRRRALPAVNAAIMRRMAEGMPVVLFAEATTGDGSRLLPFSAVHMAAARDLLAAHPEVERVSVKTVSIAYTRRCGLAATRSDRTRLAWFGDTELVPHLLDLLRGAPTSCEIVWSESPAFVRGDDRKARMRDARGLIRRSFVTSLRHTDDESPVRTKDMASARPVHSGQQAICCASSHPESGTEVGRVS